MSVKELLESGVHFGHRVSRWNPKMRPYIFGKRNLIHIIDVRETVKGLLLACRFLEKVAARGRKILLVGTKRQASGVIEEEAVRCGMPFVTDRWIGGSLTNFATVRSRLKALEELEQMETSGRLVLYVKKEQARLLREKRKLTRNLRGIRAMTELPGALVVVDPKREVNAVHEARTCKIPLVAVIDTDGDPELVDIPIPANDDAMRVIQILVRKLVDAIAEGKAKIPAVAALPLGKVEGGKPQAADLSRPSVGTATAGSAAEPKSSQEAPGQNTGALPPDKTVRAAAVKETSGLKGSDTA